MRELRPFQKEALIALEAPPFESRHVLCVAPTGSGKSLIYEKAAALCGRRTLLITPLVALARQQYEKLKKKGVSTSLGTGGESKNPPPSKTGTWIMSPEMLRSPKRQHLLKLWQPNLLVVDECHCLWEWGETFRPAFFLIPQLLNADSIKKSLWLTATLPFEARLRLRKLIPQHLVELGGFELPPRLRLSIRRAPWGERSQILLNWIKNQTGAGIIFVPTREGTYRLSRLIEANGKKTICYHGGMSSEERRNVEVLVELKIPDVIISTSAFGMGMDYPHLTYVVLWQAPTSLLSMVQSIGRVGRSPHADGHALILWDQEDFQMLEWTTRNSIQRRTEIQDLLSFLSSNECRRIGLKRYFDRIELKNTCNLCDYCLQMRHYSIN